MMQTSLATCCEFPTGLHIVGSGICALLEGLRTLDLVKQAKGLVLHILISGENK